VTTGIKDFAKFAEACLSLSKAQPRNTYRGEASMRLAKPQVAVLFALDHPVQVARHAEKLLRIALDSTMPHALLRHFAARALVVCSRMGTHALTESQLNDVLAVNVSPFPKAVQTGRRWERGGLDDSRPREKPKPAHDFHLDYDFEQYRVQNLGRVFGKPTWEVRDAISRIVKEFDQTANSMYDKGGREASSSRFGRMSSDYHSYGEQLGWNGLYVAAAEFLSKHPVTDDSYDDDPWPDWLNDELLTREDGLWLADGMDPTPSETQVNLLERGEKELAIIGNKKKLLALVGIDSSIGAEVVVEGSWRSPDGIRVHISSALVDPKRASGLLLRLTEEEPFRVWLPTLKDTFGDDRLDKEPEFKAWIVSPSAETRLDGNDPLGAACATSRPYFADEIMTLWPLKKSDSFGREWLREEGQRVARVEAWGRTSPHQEEGPSSGQRLLCSSSFLKEVLAKKRAELLLLIKLERYEKRSHNESGQFSHTIAVLRISADLTMQFHKGAVNAAHKRES
jgi:hypothetical protein